jgi:hypothetical protein
MKPNNSDNTEDQKIRELQLQMGRSLIADDSKNQKWSFWNRVGRFLMKPVSFWQRITGRIWWG